MDRPLGDGPVQKGTSAMLWRHLCLVRARSAAGLVGGIILIGGAIAVAQAADPADPEPSSPPVGVATETVDILKARKAGDLTVVARGQGQDRVHLTIRNSSARRLNVIIPPGLVASNQVGQAGAGGGRGGMQSMGLGATTNREGAFGQFQASPGPGGLQSIPATGDVQTGSVTVPVGESIDLSIPAVCLNFGLPTPTPRDTFRLVDVDEYTSDVRIRRALRSLATYGTSHGVAQAAMWRVCNNVTFEAMAEQAGRVINTREIALASRFVEALDDSTSSELVDSTALAQSRIFIRVRGEKALTGDAVRLGGQLEGLRLLGLPLQVVESEEPASSSAPALFLNVVLTDAQAGETHGRILVSSCIVPNSWVPLGKVSFRDNSSISVLDGDSLCKAIDRAIAGAFVTVKPARRAVGSTTLKVENRLPFTVSQVVVRAGTSSGAPSVPFQGIGVGPTRSALLPIQAATATLVEHVELNGL